MNLVAAVFLAQLATPARITQPVLSFPQAGLDDSASYQGYQTRFYKDAAGNTVQIYLDQRAGRIVHLLANSEDESAAFSIRGATGQPVPVEWLATDAEVATRGRAHSLAHRMRARASEVRIGWFVLGSMRIERDVQYQRVHLAPYRAQPFVLPEMLRFVDAIGRLGPADRRRHLARLGVNSLPALRARLRPVVTVRPGARWSVRAAQPSLDGRDTVALEILVDPSDVAVTRTPSHVSLRAKRGNAVPFTVRVTSTARPLTPLARAEIFTPAFLGFLQAADTTTTRGKWLERQVRGVELLSSHEKLMAGLPAYATYFGRDMLLSALMMRPIWRDEMSEFVIASALRKLSDRGEVSHEEALGGQAAREAAMDYTRLIDAWGAARAAGNAGEAAARLAEAYALLSNVRRVRENYHMIDDEFQLAVIAGRWLADPAVPAARKRAFLLDSADGGGPRLRRLLMELALVSRMTDAYARDPIATNLVSFQARDTGWSSASWRDSGAGYAGGRFAMDVNAIWAPHALEAIGDVVVALGTLGFSLDSLARTVPELGGDSPFGAYMRDASRLDQAIATWWGAGRHFLVRLSPDDVRGRVGQRLAALPEEERRHWTGVLAATRADADSLEFLALSLDASGHPIGVANTDPATRLFLGESRRRPDPDERRATLRDVRLFVRSYPVGLFIDRVGPVVANDAFAPAYVWPVFERDRYHGPRVVWGREVNLFLLGVTGRLARIPDAAGSTAAAADATELRAAINKVVEAVQSSGFRSELWSYEFIDGRPVPIRYGSGSDVQLWSTTDLAVQFALSRLGMSP